jgi:integrase
MTVDEMLERAFDLRGTPPNTRRTYTYCVHHFEKFVGSPVTELGRQQVEQFLLHLVRERRLSASSHNVYAAALRFLYDAALDRPEVMVRVPRRKQAMRLPVLLAPAEIVRLLAAIPSIAVRTIVMLAYAAGLRVSEACKLRVEDIDSRQMLLHIRNAKRGRERYVMLSPRMTRDGSARSSASPPCFIPGRVSWASIPTCTASSPAAGSPPTARHGAAPAATSCCLCA